MSEPKCDLLREGPQEFLSRLLKQDKDRERAVSNLFARELAIIDKALELQLQGFQAIGEDNTGAKFRVAVQMLLTLLFNHLVAARKLIVTGYIAESTTLLARALEVNWLALYLDRNPNEIGRWQESGIKPKDLRKLLKVPKVEKDLWDTLNKHGHPNFLGSVAHVDLEKTTPDSPSFYLGGHSNKHSLKVVFKWLALVQWSSLMTMGSVSEGFLNRNVSWSEGRDVVTQEMRVWLDSV